MCMNNSFYFNIRDILPYNALFNFVIGNRGGGKTFSAKDFCISQFLKKDEQFIYLRRYKDEIQKTSKTFFNDVSINYENTHFEVKGNNGFINDKVACYFFPLSTAPILKSMSFPDVKYIIFDEFIIDKSNYRYLQNEVTAFLEFYETIARMRDVKVFFLANAITMTNPYFLYFNLSLPYNKNTKLFNDNLILLHLHSNQKYIEEKSKTKFGKIIKNTDYYNYAVNNSFLRDNNNFIEKKSKFAKFFFPFSYKNTVYGVWIDYNASKLFISLDYDPSFPLIYSTTLEDHSPNKLLLKNPNKSHFWRQFINAYKNGLMRFENIKIKNICTDLIKNILF